MSYNKILQQRNGYLKSLAGNTADTQLLDVYDRQLVMHGNYVFEQRKLFLQKLVPLVKSFYEQIAGSTEDMILLMKAALLQTSFDKLLIQNREKDIMLQRTTQGIHRDDLDLTLAIRPLNPSLHRGNEKVYCLR